MKKVIIGILKKIKKIIKRMFGNSNLFLPQKLNTKSSKKNSSNNTVQIKTTAESIINHFEQERALLVLQKKYENGEIKEEDLSQNEKNKLTELYKKQIESLQDQKKQYYYQIKKCKDQISKALYSK